MSLYVCMQDHIRYSDCDMSGTLCDKCGAKLEPFKQEEWIRLYPHTGRFHLKHFILQFTSYYKLFGQKEFKYKDRHSRVRSAIAMAWNMCWW